MLKLNAELVDALLDELGIDGLADLSSRVGVHRSTLSRWLRGSLPTLPGSPEQLLALARALDTDPAGLFTYAPSDFPRMMSRLMRAARQRRWEKFHPAMEFAEQLVAPSAEWPPKAIADAFHRRWHVVDLLVDPVTQGIGYATVRLTPDFGFCFTARPKRMQVWHVAFQDTGGPIPQRVAEPRDAQLLPRTPQGRCAPRSLHGVVV